MAANTLNILKPSVNNLTARIFIRAAGLDFEEVDVWGKTTRRSLSRVERLLQVAAGRCRGRAARAVLP